MPQPQAVVFTNKEWRDIMRWRNSQEGPSSLEVERAKNALKEVREHHFSSLLLDLNCMRPGLAQKLFGCREYVLEERSTAELI
jgi:hypothetical protein